MIRLVSLLLGTQTYQIAPLVKLHWRCWNDEYVVFDQTSGHTHQMEPVRAFVLTVLSDKSLNFTEMLNELSTVPALDHESGLRELLKSVLTELTIHGLVEEAIP